MDQHIGPIRAITPFTATSGEGKAAKDFGKLLPVLEHLSKAPDYLHPDQREPVKALSEDILEKIASPGFKKPSATQLSDVSKRLVELHRRLQESNEYYMFRVYDGQYRKKLRP